jgi:hypothetical protein
MGTYLNKKNYTDWLIVSLLSAGSRILETLSMILPVKAIFVLMKPDLLPSIWFELGLNLSHFLVAIIALVTFTLLLGKILHVFAKRKASLLQHVLENESTDNMALIITKITSSIIVMIIFAAIVGFIDVYALLLLLILISLTFIQIPILTKDLKAKLYRLLGITRDEARFRLVSQLLFLIYFMLLLTITLQQDTKVTITLLLVMLVGRRFFQEFSRFRIGSFQKRKFASGNLIDI